MDFSSEEISQIQEHGLQVEDVNEQLQNFVSGFEFRHLERAATIGDGIRRISKEEQQRLIHLYEQNKDRYDIMKFVPASGAATRMMKDMYAFVNDYKDEDSTPLKDFPSVEKTINGITHFAFYEELCNKIKANGEDIDTLLANKEYKSIIEYILLPKGLNYGKSPKAFIPFHIIGGESITPLEQHIIEGLQYASSKGSVDIEFTCSEEHIDGFKAICEEIVSEYEQIFEKKINITFSLQSHSTDTISVDMNNNPIHDKNGRIVFRPSGHGALIYNLNRLNKDIVFIKNIDNLSSKYIDVTQEYKKLLAGVLIEEKENISSKLHEIEADDSQKELFDKLNRPIRICGMVKNTGEPGGGPFYVNKKGKISLQIVEKSEVDMNNVEQRNIFISGTHFNPVDLVTSTRDYKGRKFDLEKYVDKSAGFISEKSFEGRKIKAMERAGLWNGAMSGFYTIFVEVPLETFTPVKVLTDLLKEEHQ